jgi:hypothetical protein
MNIPSELAAGGAVALAIIGFNWGGCITGFTDFDPTMGSKWLELLKLIAPGIARVAVIFNPKSAPYAAWFLGSIVAAAPARLSRGTESDR